MNDIKYYTVRNNGIDGISTNYSKLIKNLNENLIYNECPDYKSAFNSFVQCSHIEDESKYIIYTDGSCIKNKAKIAYGYIVIRNHKIIKQYSKMENGNSSGLAELKAVDEAIKYIKENKISNKNIVICTDSDEVVYRYKEKDILIMKIKGHNSDPYNTYVDQLLKHRLKLVDKINYGIFKKSYFKSIIAC